MKFAGYLRTAVALAVVAMILAPPAGAAVTAVTVGLHTTCPYGLIA